MLETISYSLDRKNNIEHIEGPWSEFALQNQGQSIADPGNVLGRDLMSFVEGSETQSFYRQVLESVRKSQRAVEVPFFCDAPDIRREMLLRFQPIADDRVWIDSIPIKSFSREPIHALRSSYERSQDSIKFCSICRRVALAPDDWQLPDSIKIDPAFKASLSNGSTSVIEQICHDCSANCVSCRYILTEKFDSGHKSKPTLFFFHGAQNKIWSLRLFERAKNLFPHGPDSIRIVSPVLKSGNRWKHIDLDAIYEAVAAETKLDPNRVCMTGFSAGAAAMYSWVQARGFPVSALVPIGANLVVAPSGASMARKQVPSCWAYVGENDPLVSIPLLQNWYKHACRYNADTKLSQITDGGHNILQHVYSDPELWRWIAAKAARVCSPHDETAPLTLPHTTRCPSSAS